MDKALTRLEKQWVMYDVGNSAFVMLVSTIMPIYFNYLADQGGLSSVQYLAYWGYASSIATLLVALSGPVFGTFSDIKGMKKPLFAAAMAVGALGCAALGFMKQWLLFLVVFVVAKFGYAVSLIFYDSMLTDITEPERMDRVSSSGYAWGYIGSCIPFVACLGIVLGSDSLGISMEMAMTLAFLLTAVWWLCMTLPLLRSFHQRYYVERRPHAVRMSFSRLWHTLCGMRQEKQVLFFLLAFFFYIDGVYTIIDMATAYGSALGLDSTGLLLALLVTQIVACPFSLLFGRLSGRIEPQQLITVCICAYVGIAVFAMFLHSQVQFWILAVCVGMFQGGIQALSRSYFAKIIPQEKSGEYFGLLDICGKGAAFMGTAVVSIISQVTGSMNLGVGAIVVLFLLGIILFRKAVAYETEA
ncbi:MFS transporter [Butyricicoccus porcorum]|uniref:MFS transporter n=1 Tax=Butyricicoccus porcorum TaxID=1945634 RepID=A0A252F449_9FIRM|nr:MFS transporter [Butyricicoccus porcorum]MCI6926239.1 MFS transporter [Butyricicoccus porcorum]MDD6987186.1 MFS transporter [Butyricicoccus porcorum]OUM20555.1 MFS transporter [Butyricicoccus porcorum]